MPLHYICDYTIAYVKYFHYICTAYHITGGRGHRRMECPFFVRQWRSERSGDAPEGSKVVLPPLFPLTRLRDRRNSPVPKVVESQRHAATPLRQRQHLASGAPPLPCAPRQPSLLIGLPRPPSAPPPPALRPGFPRRAKRADIARTTRRGLRRVPFPPTRAGLGAAHQPEGQREGKGRAREGKGLRVTALTSNRYQTFLISLQILHLCFIN